MNEREIEFLENPRFVLEIIDDEIEPCIIIGVKYLRSKEAPSMVFTDFDFDETRNVFDVNLKELYHDLISYYDTDINKIKDVLEGRCKKIKILSDNKIFNIKSIGDNIISLCDDNGDDGVMLISNLLLKSVELIYDEKI